jgi:hypothetical protein
MLEMLNAGSQGNTLIKKDLYRLAIALAVEETTEAPIVSGKTEDFLRVAELDEDRVLYVAVQASGLCGPDEPVYTAMERLAEHGIAKFYKAFKSNMDELPWEKILV